MSRVLVLEKLSIQVSNNEVLRYLGYRRASHPSPKVMQSLEEIWERAIEMLEPKGCYTVVSGEEATLAVMPEPTRMVGLGLVTIGPNLEAEASRLCTQSQMLHALLLDAIGSAAADAAADALNQKLCLDAQANSYQLAPRISPGYGGWRLEGQRELLRLLDAQSIGIRLTDGMMMIPRKSISFAVRFEDRASRIPHAPGLCSLCEMKACAFRKTPAEDD